MTSCDAEQTLSVERIKFSQTHHIQSAHTRLIAQIHTHTLYFPLQPANTQAQTFVVINGSIHSQTDTSSLTPGQHAIESRELRETLER
jgi:hypothetical protein